MEVAKADSNAEQEDMYAYVKVLIAARLAVISFFMGVMAYYQVKHGASFASSPALQPIGATYILTIIYAVFSGIVRKHFLFAYIQLLIDALLVGWIIFCTGGTASQFSFIFFLIIVGSAFLRSRTAPFVLATLSSLFYCLLIALEHNGIISPYNTFLAPQQSQNLTYIMVIGLVNSVAFYLVAIMTGYFTGQLQKKDKQLIEQGENFTSLKTFHEFVLSNMTLGFIAIGNDKKVLSHNLSAEKILNLSAVDINNKDADVILGVSELSDFIINRGNRSALSRNFEWRYRDKNGNNLELSMVVNKLMVSGVVNGAIGILQDVTEHRTMQRQVESSERLAAIGRVAAGMAHEIRNPLASLSGSIQMINADLEHLLDSKNVRLMDIIMRETDRLNSIITQFLSYASAPSIVPEKADVSELLLETMVLIKSNPGYSAKINIKSDVEKGLVANVDQERIRQVIWNLCINAIDAMAKDGGDLVIRAHKEKSLNDSGAFKNYELTPLDEFSEYIRISVHDTGEGIDQGNLQKIFEPFFTTKQNGTGLGLPMVYKLVELHKGKISAQSKKGEETIFTIWLPTEGVVASKAEHLEHKN